MEEIKLPEVPTAEQIEQAFPGAEKKLRRGVRGGKSARISYYFANGQLSAQLSWEDSYKHHDFDRETNTWNTPKRKPRASGGGGAKRPRKK